MTDIFAIAGAVVKVLALLVFSLWVLDVLAKYFGWEPHPRASADQVERLLDKIMALPPEERAELRAIVELKLSRLREKEKQDGE